MYQTHIPFWDCGEFYLLTGGLCENATRAMQPSAPPTKPKRSRGKTEAPQACDGCGKPANNVGATRCYVCKANGWRRYCSACESSHLLKCSGCNEFSCKTCFVPQGQPLSGSGMEEHWAAPCTDPAHRGPNERFCSESCMRLCGSCSEGICNDCFLSSGDMACRQCVLIVVKEVQEWDARRNANAAPR